VQGSKPAFDVVGTVLSAVGLFFVVIGILQAGDYGWLTARQDFVIGNTVLIEQGGISPVWLFIALGAGFLAWFFFHIRAFERAGKEPLLSTRLFHNRVSNLGLITQNTQWLMLLGTSFTVSVFLQVVRGFSAIETGLLFLPATIGLLLSSSSAGRLARRRSQRTIVRVGFVLTLAGLLLLLLPGAETAKPLVYFAFGGGLFVLGLGVGLMLTSSVTIVQSAFPEEDQGEISGLSRSVSNLGSSFGTAIAGSILVSAVNLGSQAYALALASLAVFGVIGLVAAILLPADAGRAADAGLATDERQAA
jgi:predicted MFS family arabinose efflux permease